MPSLPEEDLGGLKARGDRELACCLIWCSYLAESECTKYASTKPHQRTQRRSRLAFWGSQGCLTRKTEAAAEQYSELKQGGEQTCRTSSKRTFYFANSQQAAGANCCTISCE